MKLVLLMIQISFTFTVHAHVCTVVKIIKYSCDYILNIIHYTQPLAHECLKIVKNLFSSLLQYSDNAQTDPNKCTIMLYKIMSTYLHVKANKNFTNQKLN